MFQIRKHRRKSNLVYSFGGKEKKEWSSVSLSQSLALMLTQGPALYDLMWLVKMAAIMYTINKSSAVLSQSESVTLMLGGFMPSTYDLWTPYNQSNCRTLEVRD